MNVKRNEVVLQNPSRLFNAPQYKKFTLTWMDKVKAWIFIEEDHPRQTWW